MARRLFMRTSIRFDAKRRVRFDYVYEAVIVERVILHCDMNNYFATVEEKYTPSLRAVPFAVCGDPAMRHGIVMAKNQLAKNAGVITGISYNQARKLCPGLQCVTADYPKYLKEAKEARRIYRKYTDEIIPYGLDEAWVDLSLTGASMRDAVQIADLIRLEIKYSQGLSASVGVSDNYIFSKLGSDYKKPDAVTVITRDNYRPLVWELPASELLFVGKKRKKLLADCGICTIGDIARAGPVLLRKILGKAGYDLWCFSNGDDSGFNPKNDTIASVGNTITPPRDIDSPGDAAALIYMIVCSVCARLRKHGLAAAAVSISMRDSCFNTVTRRCALPHPTNNIGIIFYTACELFVRNYSWESPLRSVGVRADKLEESAFEQLSLFDEAQPELCAQTKERLRVLSERMGGLQTEKSAGNKDW